MDEEVEILKVDEAGRVRTPRERQDAVTDEFERSGMTGMQFARHVGVKYPTLMNWVQRRRRERKDEAAKGGQGPQWIEALVEGNSCGGTGLVIEVPGGVLVRVADRVQAGVAVEVLRGLGYNRSC